MPTISFVTPKGGAGKTTSVIILACELARSGSQVTIIDSDPNHHVEKWANRKPIHENITVVTDVNESNIIDVIDDAAQKTPFVIIDVEGSANMSMTWAVSRSDLVLIPVQPSQFDADEAVRAIKLIKTAEKGTRGKINFAVFFSRTDAAIQTKSYKHLQQEFAQNNIPLLSAELINREPFRAIMSFGGSITDLEKNSGGNIKSAQTNALVFAKEIIALIKSFSNFTQAA